LSYIKPSTSLRLLKWPHQERKTPNTVDLDRKGQENIGRMASLLYSLLAGDAKTSFAIMH